MAPSVSRSRSVSFAALVLVVSIAFFAGPFVGRPLSSAALIQDRVTLAPGSAVALATPPFIQAGRRYAFTWPGGGPPQTYTVKSIRQDGWILVDVAEENVDPAFLVPGQTPTRWLHVGLAVSVQEMRPLPY